MWRQTLSEYGMVLVLLLLCGLLSALTWAEQHPVDAAAARQVISELPMGDDPALKALIVVGDNRDDQAFAAELARGLADKKYTLLGTVQGKPADARQKLEELARAGKKLDLVLATNITAAWGVIERMPVNFPAFANVKVVMPTSYYWPTFLQTSNLLNIANQIAVIAMMAIGMTMVIIAGGIDLSVGSLLGLGAVLTTLLIRDYAGAREATAFGMVLCAGAAILATALIGTFSGFVTTLFKAPSFIVTLSMMLVARGLARKISQGNTINEVPQAINWLGRGADFLGLPNSVVLMLLLYLAAHVVMTRTTFGRYLYAVGGNAEAARLSGVPVRRVIVLAFTICGALAGLGGVVQASLFESSAPTYGQDYELYVIAAAVVGGTSLAGGEGKIFGTLIGAFLIGVVKNGMNLLGLKDEDQVIVLGLVILGAVLLDSVRRNGLPRL